MNEVFIWYYCELVIDGGVVVILFVYQCVYVVMCFGYVFGGWYWMFQFFVQCVLGGEVQVGQQVVFLGILQFWVGVGDVGIGQQIQVVQVVVVVDQGGEVMDYYWIGDVLFLCGY